MLNDTLGRDRLGVRLISRSIGPEAPAGPAPGQAGSIDPDRGDAGGR